MGLSSGRVVAFGRLLRDPGSERPEGGTAEPDDKPPSPLLSTPARRKFHVRPRRHHPRAPRSDAPAQQAARRHRGRAHDRACLAPGGGSRRRPGRGGDGRARHRRGGRKGRRPRGDDPRGPRLRVGPDRRSRGQARPGRAARCRRERAGRFSDDRSALHRRRGAPAPRQARGRRHARLPHLPRGRAHQPQRGEDDRHRDRARPLPGALFHAGHGADRRGAALAPYRRLRLSPPGARNLRLSAAVARSRGASGSSSSARIEAGFRIDAVVVDDVPFGVDTPEQLEEARRLLSRRKSP